MIRFILATFIVLVIAMIIVALIPTVNEKLVMVMEPNQKGGDQ